MIQKVFGVRDAKALAFLQPFFSASTGAAVRAFADAVNEDSKSPLAKHPEDYILYELASFDDNTGEFIPCEVLKMLGCASDFVNHIGKVFPGVSLNPESLIKTENGEKNG